MTTLKAAETLLAWVVASTIKQTDLVNLCKQMQILPDLEDAI